MKQVRIEDPERARRDRNQGLKLLAPLFCVVGGIVAITSLIAVVQHVL